MPNRKTSNLDRLRTKVWATMAIVAAGNLSSIALEDLLKERKRGKDGTDSDYKETAGSWQRYLTGRAKPFRTWEPCPKALWVDECEESFPGTAAWFYSPIWYLLEDVEYLPNQILECVRLLPEHLRDDLLVNGIESTRGAFLLADLDMNAPFHIAAEVSIWSIGAMACVMRRAELSGKSPLFRRSGIGVIWLLDQLDPTIPAQVRPLLRDLRGLVVDMLDKFVYPMSGPIIFPPTAKDFDRFRCEVQRVHAIDKAIMNDDYDLADHLTSRKWFELPVEGAPESPDAAPQLLDCPPLQ